MSEAGTIHRWFSGAYLMRSSGHILLMIKNCLVGKNTSTVTPAAAIYRQQKVLSHFPLCCWIDWLLMIKNCLIESGPPCRKATKIVVMSLSHCQVDSKPNSHESDTGII
jgi:hypothetical protein